MRRVTQPATIYFDGRLYLLKPEQWQRLRSEIQGLYGKELAIKGREFLFREGLVKDG